MGVGIERGGGREGFKDNYQSIVGFDMQMSRWSLEECFRIS